MSANQEAEIAGAAAPPPRRDITGRQLALVRLEGVLQHTAWMAVCARHACEAEGDATMAAKLKWLEDALAGMERLCVDEAYPLNPVVRT